MSLLWEKSPGWRWLVRRTRDSKPFFFTFAALCGVVPGVIGFCVMQATNTRSDELESHLRRTSRPESNVTSLFNFTPCCLGYGDEDINREVFASCSTRPTCSYVEVLLSVRCMKQKLLCRYLYQGYGFLGLKRVIVD